MRTLTTREQGGAEQPLPHGEGPLVELQLKPSHTKRGTTLGSIEWDDPLGEIGGPLAGADELSVATDQRAAPSQKFWVAADQIASSATNFAGAALTAGLLTANGFGGWAVAYAAFVALLAATRTSTGDVLLILLPAAPADRARRLASGAIAFALAAGLLTGTGAAIFGLTREGATKSALLALSLALPALLVQDTVRLALLAEGRARAAFANDGVWLTLAVISLMLLRITNTASVFWAMLAWAGTALPAALIGLRQLRATTRDGAIRGWWSSARSLATGMLGAHALYLLASLTMVSLVVGFAQGAEPVGSIRGVQSLLGPITVVFAATSLYVQPVLVRRLSAGQDVMRSALGLSLANVAVTAVCAASLWATPRFIGTRLFGATWDGAHHLIPAMAAVLMVSAIASGASVVLRAQHRVAETVRVALVMVVVVIPVTILAARALAVGAVLAVYAALSLPGAFWLWLAAARPIHPNEARDPARSAHESEHAT